MKTKLIQTKDYLLLIDEEAEIKVSDFITDTYKVWQWRDDSSLLGRKLIIAYYPLTKEAKELDLPLLPNPFEGEDYVEQLSHRYYFDLEEKREKAKNFKGQITGRHPDMLTSREMYAAMGGFVDGYKAAQSDKQFSLEDVKKAIQLTIQFMRNKPSQFRDCEEEIIQSLSTQQLPKEFVPEIEQYTQNYHKDIWYNRIKTITNSEGKEELVGEYGY